MKRVIIFTFEDNKYVESVRKYLASKNIETVVASSDECIDNTKEYDLGVVWSYDSDIQESLYGKIPFIYVQPSLLPKFDTKNPIEDNFYSNDKYGGVTIHYSNNEQKFLTQESFWKEDSISLEKFNEQIFEIASRLLPRVIEDIIYEKINVLVLTDKLEPYFHELLLKSKVINKLYVEDLSCDFLHKYSDSKLDICLFDISSQLPENIAMHCSMLGITPVRINAVSRFKEKNICLFDGKNKLEFFDTETSFDDVFQTSELKQIVVNNLDASDFSHLSEALETDFGEILMKIMLEKLDYTFLHWKK